MKNILAMSAAQTYDLVMDHFVHAFPNVDPYPKKNASFFIPVGPKGVMECLFAIQYSFVCDPKRLKSKKEELDSKNPVFYKLLMNYHKARNKHRDGTDFVGYREGCEFVFLILCPLYPIRQPFKQHIRNAKYFSIDEVPVIGMGNNLEPIKAGNTWIFSYNKSFALHWAMSMLPSIDWDVRNRAVLGKVKENDIVYLYGAAPEQEITYRCRVIKAGKTHTTVDDSAFGGNPAGTPCDCVELEMECRYEDGIPYKELLEHGLKKGVLTKRRIDNPDLVAFLREYDADENHIENWFKEEIDDNDIEDDSISGEEEQIVEEIEKSSLKGEDRDAVIKARVNQGIFRDRLLRYYPNKCCLCGVSNHRLLVASHIIPWSECEGEDRLDPDNGLLMCPSHDKLFDKHLISFKDDGSILISKKLTKNDRKGMNVNESMRIQLTKGNRKYLKDHRKKFKDEEKRE